MEQPVASMSRERLELERLQSQVQGMDLGHSALHSRAHSAEADSQRRSDGRRVVSEHVEDSATVRENLSTNLRKASSLSRRTLEQVSENNNTIQATFNAKNNADAAAGPGAPGAKRLPMPQGMRMPAQWQERLQAELQKSNRARQDRVPDKGVVAPKRTAKVPSQPSAQRLPRGDSLAHTRSAPQDAHAVQAIPGQATQAVPAQSDQAIQATPGQATQAVPSQSNEAVSGQRGSSSISATLGPPPAPPIPPVPSGPMPIPIPTAGTSPSTSAIPSGPVAPAVTPARPPGGLMTRRQGSVSKKPPGLTLSALQAKTTGEPGTPGFKPKARPSALPGGVPSAEPFANFRRIIDPSGRLNFSNKAVLHSSGVNFTSGVAYNIRMDDLELYEELGKGNYGTVKKVWHRPTKVMMALKEIQLELDHSKLKTIQTELDVLNRATSPYIIDFYGAFFIESCVYYCMEYMDAGSLNEISGIPVPEPVLRRVTSAMVNGLRFLKDELQIMHRDVKPTNVLLNKKGDVKLCDFGVSGQLESSLAKTNIGCQSYMAPERIDPAHYNGETSSYSVASDVWSLGLSIIEFIVGHYPYPPETYSNLFAQLNAIVHGDTPTLPEGYSPEANDFVNSCLQKDASRRSSYAQLLEMPFLQGPFVSTEDFILWIEDALVYAEQQKERAKAKV